MNELRRRLEALRRLNRVTRAVAPGDAKQRLSKRLAEQFERAIEHGESPADASEQLVERLRVAVERLETRDA